MDERLRNWQPTQAEVDEIVRSLRPLIRELARRDQEKIATEIIRRRRRIAQRALACPARETKAAAAPSRRR